METIFIICLHCSVSECPSFCSLGFLKKDLYGIINKNILKCIFVEIQYELVLFFCTRSGRRKSTAAFLIFAGLACVFITCLPENNRSKYVLSEANQIFLGTKNLIEKQVLLVC